MIKINVRTIESGEISSEIKEVIQVHVVNPNIESGKPRKIVQIWSYINSNIKKVFSLISSCFGSGTWMSSEKWSDTEFWKSY